MRQRISPIHVASIALPLVVGWCWPRSYGPSLEAFPLLLGIAIAGIAALNIQRLPSNTLTLWLAGVVISIALRSDPYAQYMLMLIPVALAVWIAMGLGATARLVDGLWNALMWAVLIAAMLNLLSAVVQFLGIADALYPLVSLNGSNRPYGNLRQPNHLATLLVIAEGVLWWGRAERRWSMTWTIPAALAGVWGIALTGSRIGALELLMLAGLAFAWRRPSDRASIRLFVSLPLALLPLSWLTGALARSTGLGVATVSDRVTGVSGGDVRWSHWAAAWNMIVEHPWLGVGWREFRLARFLERPQDSTVEVAENAHNIVLHLAAELGLPIMLAILVPCVYFLARSWRRSHQEPRRQWGLLVLLAIGVHSLVEYPWAYMNFLFIGGVAAGVLAEPGAQPSWLTRSRMALVSLGVTSLALIAWVDYDRVAAAYGSSVTSQPTDRQAALEQAQRTALFRAYADYALVTQVPVTTVNHAAMIALTDRLMHFGPDPAILEAAIMARCAAGDTVRREELAQRYKIAFPKAYAAFVARTPDTLRGHCALALAP